MAFNARFTIMKNTVQNVSFAGPYYYYYYCFGENIINKYF